VWDPTERSKFFIVFKGEKGISLRKAAEDLDVFIQTKKNAKEM
jgi:hypothetical protein